MRGIDPTHDPFPRRRVKWLVLFALALVSVHRAEAPPPPANVVAERPSAVSMEASVASLLGDVNSTLGASELARVARAVVRYSEKYGLDPILVTAVIKQESSARPGVRSHKGAIGLMQVMPHMMSPLGLAGNFATVESNIEAGCLILASNIRRLGERDGVSAYFWGSEIRDHGYFERVSATRAEMRRRLRL